MCYAGGRPLDVQCSTTPRYRWKASGPIKLNHTPPYKERASYLKKKDFSFRFLWVVALLVAFGLVCYVIVENLIKYIQDPKVLGLDVDYNETLRFPAVTLCNYNMFRSGP